MKRATFNERGYRVGETRLNSKLSDHDVTLIVGLLNARLEVIEQCQSIGMRQGEIDRALAFKQLSYRWIADKFEVSKMTVKSIADGRTRCHAIVHTKRGK